MERVEDSNTTLLTGRGIGLRVGDNWVLENVDLSISAREIVTLIGLNGSGKTSLVHALLGLVAVERGQVIRRPDLRVGFVPQTVSRDPTLPITVARFVALMTRSEPQKISKVLKRVGAEHVKDRMLADLSGGEFRRVLLARAILRRPHLLVLDEPLAGIDIAGQSQLYGLLAELRDELGCGVLMVSHDLHVVMAATDTVVCLNKHVCCTGHPQSVARHPEFIALFGQQVADNVAVYSHHHDHHHDSAGNVVPERE